jgi:hypothetical protein
VELALGVLFLRLPIAATGWTLLACLVIRRAAVRCDVVSLSASTHSAIAVLEVSIALASATLLGHSICG